MSDHEQEFSLKNLFVPLTTFKAIHIIVILGFIVFGNMLFNGFVWDDKKFILANPAVHTINIFIAFGSNLHNSAGFYRPLQPFYFSIIYALFKDAPFFYHISQLILHIVNASLVFLFFKKFFNKTLSLFLACIFLIHPMQVEAVSYIAATGDELFFLFGMIALLLSFKNDLHFKTLSILFGLLLLSICTRETGFLFLLVILLQRALFRKRDITLYFVYGLVTTLLYFFMRFILVGIFLEKFQFIPIARLTLLERLTNLPLIIFYYLKTFFIPINLAIYQYWIVKVISFQSFYFPLFIEILLLLLIIILGRYLFRQKRDFFFVLTFFFLWLVSGLGLHSQIFPLDMTVAEHWFYFPMVGLLGILGVAIQQIPSIHGKTIKRIGYVIAIVFIVILSARTMVRNTNWSDAVTLYSHDINISDNFGIENDLGVEYSSMQKYDKALQHLYKSAEMFPYETNYYNIGFAYEQMGNGKKAKEYYYKAINAKEYSGETRKIVLLGIYERLGFTLLRYDGAKEAKKFITKALKDYPNSANLWLQLAVVEYKLHHQDDAVAAAEKARTLLPSEQVNSIYLQIKNKQAVDLKL